MIPLLSGPVLTASPRPDPHHIRQSLPLITMWVWIDLLPLDMNNQFGKDDFKEDARNKPWATHTGWEADGWGDQMSYFGSICRRCHRESIFRGVLAEFLALILEGWVYIQLGAANDSCLARNVLNAAGYMTFAAGAAKVLGSCC